MAEDATPRSDAASKAVPDQSTPNKDAVASAVAKIEGAERNAENYEGTPLAPLPSSHVNIDRPDARDHVLVFLNSLCGGAKPGLRDTASSPADFFNTTATPNPVLDAWATLCRQPGSSATGGAV
ncbi:hypothetical protein HPB47_018332 [Ixodes persulcatus]|uniref:Uncharacterized protein n=1 Tax=Ixodes persulcatus TaxID=34615 RepID=A0AC60R0P2_IXOPE|nr:hypothetical protein HPB47_018332 [Ixodes persulcatus]